MALKAGCASPQQDGVITREELAQAARALGQPLSEEQINALVASADMNSDDVLDFEEWLSVLRVARLLS